MKDIQARKAGKTNNIDGAELLELDWEEIDEMDAIEGFEEIDEQDAVERYIVVELMAAK